MKKILLLIAAIIIAAGAADAQLGNLGSRLINKAVNKATDKAIDKATDKAVDKLFEEKEEKDVKTEKTENDEPTVKSTLAEVTTVREVDWSELDAVMLPASTAPRVRLSPEIENIYRSLPELPSLKEILSPENKTMAAYGTSIDKAERALDGYVERVEQKYAKVRDEIAARQLMKTTGLTEADLKRMEDPDITEAEKEALRAKIYANALTSPQMQVLAEESSEDKASTAVAVSSAIMRREGTFIRLVLAEQRNCEAELLPVSAKRDMARSSSRIKELDEQIAARRNATARQLAERNLKEAEWRLGARRVQLNESAVQNENLSKLYDNANDRRQILEYATIASQIDYLRNVIAVLRSVSDYAQ